MAGGRPPRASSPSSAWALPLTRARGRAMPPPPARTRSRREPQKNRTAPSGPSRGSLPRPVSTTIRGGYNGGPVLRCTGTGRRGDGAPRHLRVWLRDSPVRRGRGRGDAPRRARDGGGVAWAAAGRRRGGGANRGRLHVLLHPRYPTCGSLVVVRMAYVDGSIPL